MSTNPVTLSLSLARSLRSAGGSCSAPVLHRCSVRDYSTHVTLRNVPRSARCASLLEEPVRPFARSLGLFFCFLTVAWCQPTPRKRHPSLFPHQRQLPICLRFSFRLFHWLARCQSSASSLQESWVATARKHLAAAALVAPLACSVFPATAGCYGKLLKVNRVVFLAERIRRRKQEDVGPGCL